MRVKRYDLTGCDSRMYPDRNGGWVAYADHAAEVARLEAKLDILAQAVRAWKWHEELIRACALDDPFESGELDSFATTKRAMARALEVSDD